MSERPSEVLRIAEARLSATWQGVSQDWRDAVAIEFATTFLAPLQDVTGRYLEAVRELEAALDEVEAP